MSNPSQLANGIEIEAVENLEVHCMSFNIRRFIAHASSGLNRLACLITVSVYVRVSASQSTYTKSIQVKCIDFVRLFNMAYVNCHLFLCLLFVSGPWLWDVSVGTLVSAFFVLC